MFGQLNSYSFRIVYVEYRRRRNSADTKGEQIASKRKERERETDKPYVAERKKKKSIVLLEINGL